VLLITFLYQSSYFHPQININDKIPFNNPKTSPIGNNKDENTNRSSIVGQIRNIDAKYKLNN
jgi:hypothetical protein